jgi:hypothetical protein
MKDELAHGSKPDILPSAGGPRTQESGADMIRAECELLSQ